MQGGEEPRKEPGGKASTYGTDFVAGILITKGAHYVSKLKKANHVCNLETYATSSKTGQKVLKATATELKIQRGNFFKSAKIHWDKQNKHIPGSHNYQPGKSIITISSEELEILVEKHKGTGQIIKNHPLQPDFRERIDFGKTIGIFVDVENPNVQVPTEIGMMVYDKQGKVHVVPVRPKIKVDYE